MKTPHSDLNWTATLDLQHGGVLLSGILAIGDTIELGPLKGTVNLASHDAASASFDLPSPVMDMTIEEEARQDSDRMAMNETEEDADNIRVRIDGRELYQYLKRGDCVRLTTQNGVREGKVLGPDLLGAVVVELRLTGEDCEQCSEEHEKWMNWQHEQDCRRI